jgi:hypothetical protein
LPSGKKSKPLYRLNYEFQINNYESGGDAN